MLTFVLNACQVYVWGIQQQFGLTVAFRSISLCGEEVDMSEEGFHFPGDSKTSVKHQWTLTSYM